MKISTYTQESKYVLEKYMFVSASDRFTLVYPYEKIGERTSLKSDCSMHGMCYGRINSMDGDEVTTPAIMKVEDGTAVTSMGTIYRIKEMSPDYEEFLDFVEAEVSERVIKYWNITGNRQNGFSISGFLPNSREIIEKNIISQSEKGNVLVLEDGQSYFVDWRTPSNPADLESLHVQIERAFATRRSYKLRLV